MGSAKLRIRVLGGLSIERDGLSRPAALSGRRAELVFAYLVAEHRRTVSRDELADNLWPELLPDSWAAAVRGVVTDVRRVLESAGLDPARTLITERSGYRLCLPADVALDLDEARAALAAARERLAAGDGAGAAAAAAQAEQLAGLPFLPQHDGDWVDAIRTELQAIHAGALELHVRARAQAGDARGAAEVAERLVRAEPFSELAHRLWIGALADAGDRSGALRAYEHCRALLDAELGVTPSAETEAALRRALGDVRQRGAVAAPATAVAAESAPNPLASLSVLVVEDHDFQRRTALTLLRGLGVGALDEAPDGNAALDLLARGTAPDVIVCDLDMPGIDGVEFIRRVAERGLASAVAIASALDARVLRAVQTVCEGYGLQVLGAVEKPLTARRLGELLAAYRRPPPGAEPAGVGAGAAAPGALAAALRNGAIGADFEPIVDLARGRVGGAQAVPRWQDAAAGPVAPDELLRTADAQGLTGALVDRLVELACAQLHELDGAGLEIDIWLALPDAALGDAELADRLAAAVRACDAEPGRIVCAVGRAALRRDAPAALAVLTRLRVKGFGVCLDGFGAPLPAAEQLERLPVTAVRLDPRLVGGAAADAARTAELQEAIDAAAAQELAVVGAGCASAGAFELLLALGCGHAQGPLVGAPLPGPQLAARAASWRPPEPGGAP